MEEQQSTIDVGLVAEQGTGPLGGAYDAAPGTVTIAPSVLTTIVRMTTLGQPGVLRLSPRTPSGLGRVLGKGAVAEGLRVEVYDDNSVTVDVHVIADPSISLKALGEALQTRLVRAMEHMVGMDVRSVNIFIDEIEFGPDSAQDRSA